LVSCKSGAWFYCLSIYVCSHIGWAAANIFYDSFIVDVTEKKRMDSISSRGYAYGYIGSVVPFLVVIAVILLWPGNKNATVPQAPAKIGFFIAAAWWLLFSMPMLKNVRHTHFIKKSTHPVRDGFIKLAGTFKKIKKFKQAFVFLIAYFFYIDGVDTIISMAAVYGLDSGLNAAMLILAILMIQVAAFPFALLFGRLADKYSAKSMIFVGIGVYSLITFIAFFLPTITDLKLRTLFFCILAFLVATSMGGIQALSRSYFGKLIPADHAAEFFGFYNIFGKFATISGPFIMGIVTRITGHSRFGVLGILLLFIIGGVLLKSVKEPCKN
jgi:UMF1 family MFS transporter